MPTVAVVAHAGKSFGGGSGELREVLAREGFADSLGRVALGQSEKSPFVEVTRGKRFKIQFMRSSGPPVGRQTAAAA